jgi:tryptophan synthase alpha chain
MTRIIAGVDRVAAAFEEARASGRAALVTYLTAGYPTPAATLDLVPALERAGADVVELGVPFSDPIADGPVIQRAACRALEEGVTPTLCLELAARLREQGVRLPLLFMGYYNPIHSFGPRRYARACREAGVDGLIVPDLPLGEAGALDVACRAEGLALVALVAPSTPADRLARIAAGAQGFLYLVSRPGTTGARDSLPPGIEEYVARVRRVARLPLALGFGIAGPEQVREAARLADGVVVGSAIVARAAEGVAAVEGLVRGLREAAQC